MLVARSPSTEPLRVLVPRTVCSSSGRSDTDLLFCCGVAYRVGGGEEEGREGGREGGGEGGREGGKEGRREGGREGGREERREGPLMM